VVRHTFSHFHLDIRPVLITPATAAGNNIHTTSVMEGPEWVWYKGCADVGGLPAPVTRLLENMRKLR